MATSSMPLRRGPSEGKGGVASDSALASFWSARGEARSSPHCAVIRPPEVSCPCDRTGTCGRRDRALTLSRPLRERRWKSASAALRTRSARLGSSRLALRRSQGKKWSSRNAERRTKTGSRPTGGQTKSGEPRAHRARDRLDVGADRRAAAAVARLHGLRRSAAPAAETAT